MGTAAGCTASAAIGRAATSVRLATIRSVRPADIAILKTALARRNRTSARDARTHCISGGTHRATRFAIVRIGIEIDFTAVGKKPVTVGKAGVAGAYSAGT